MTQFLVAVLRPLDFDHAASLDEAARHDIDALDQEMVAAGVRVFVGGLRPPKSAKRVEPRTGSETLVQEGQNLIAPDYMDGFWVLKCTDIDEAMI